MSLRFGKIYYWMNTEKMKSVVVATKELKLRDTYYWLNTEKVN